MVQCIIIGGVAVDDVTTGEDDCGAFLFDGWGVISGVFETSDESSPFNIPDGKSVTFDSLTFARDPVSGTPNNGLIESFAWNSQKIPCLSYSDCQVRVN